MNYRPTYFL